MKPKVRARLFPTAGGYGYDLVVTDPQATVADYLQAVAALEDREGLARQRNPGGDCYGCPRCCTGRIPLTSIDVLRLAASGPGGTIEGLLRANTPGPPNSGRPNGQGAACNWDTGLAERAELEGAGAKDDQGARTKAVLAASRVVEVVRRWGWVTVWGRAVDITLRCSEAGTCSLLDTTRGLCRHYDLRPLVCRTYFCCPTTRRAALARQAIVNRGQDELVRLLLQAAGIRGFPVNEATAPSLKRADWRPNAFSGRQDYGEVLLAKVLPPRLWRALFRPHRDNVLPAHRERPG